MQNILYCFDENYNIQATVSMFSLLKQTNEKINFHIIHKNPKSFESLLTTIEKNQNLNDYFIHEFKNKNYNFPNIKNSHVSEATYYRMFISDYVTNDFDKVLYIDPDVVCLNPFNTTVEEIEKELINRKMLVGVKTEHIKNKQNFEIFERLSIDNKYFNAGVMSINLKMWKELDFKTRLLEKSRIIEDNIIFWDQDVMNSEINGEYLELPPHLNQHPFEFPGSNVHFEKNTIFLHYSGKNKPWTKKGFSSPSSSFYKNIYKELFGKNFKISRFK